ncbi:hypothetical protein Ahy_A03g011758 [Arachis hypogaea]|uniref:MULE transposase domain-containing protein n=1 Tax=Arachis hypogaea TaxID=3818 RepID=A0A445DRN8_ARAHY|nr:hypothetical protein Ahy_A03g011758 [Arachis hypogaea]
MNPGSTVQICVKPQPDGEVIFDKMYVCLHGCKMGFKAGCHFLIGLDGAFLKTQFGGQILASMAQDANHHIYMISWAIDLELRGQLWECVRSITFQDFINNLNKIKRAYINKWPRESWTKSQFSHRLKLDNICNNACEVFNARIKEARSKSIITLPEEMSL